MKTRLVETLQCIVCLGLDPQLSLGLIGGLRLVSLQTDNNKPTDGNNNRMVSIRRPDKRRVGGGGSSSSIFTIRNAILLVIAFQSVNLTYKIVRKKNRQPSSSSDSQKQQKTLDDVWKQKQQQQQEKQQHPSLRKPAEDVRLVKGTGGAAEHDHEAFTDTDDHVEKPDPKSAAAELEKKKKKQEEEAAKAAAAAAVEAAKAAEKAAAEQAADDEDETSKEEPDSKKDSRPSEDERSDDGKKQQEQPKEAVIDPKTAEVLAKHGTGPTTLGFVVDLVDEREHPPFRAGAIGGSAGGDTTELEKKVAGLVAESSVKSCEYVEDRHLKVRPTCRDDSGGEAHLFAYNDATFPRSLCGQVVEPGKAIKLDGTEPCREPANLFPQDSPPVSGAGMPTVVVQSKPGMLSSAVVPETEREKIECDIPCAYEKGLSGSNGDHYVAGTDWSIKRIDTNPYSDSSAKMERINYKKDKYYSTMYLHSSIPLSMYSFNKYNLRDTSPIKWEDAGNKATYLLDDQCQVGGGIRRHKWHDAVKAAFEVASYGSCNHNTDLSDGETIATPEGRIAIAKKNRIHLAFESGNERDYTSPIVWESLLSGAVPAVLGARNADEFLPPHSVILASSYNDWDKFAADVKQVSENKTRWESYHAWRTDETALAAFEKKFSFTKTSPECRTCRWAYAKMYGLGWDHDQQAVREPVVPRKLCVDETSNLITQPFNEFWVQTGSKKQDTTSTGKDKCLTATPPESTVSCDGFYPIDRHVVLHDGVIDMTINSVAPGLKTESDVIMRLVFNVKNHEGAYFPNTHTLVTTKRGPLASSASIQDEKVKVTVLANWETSIRSPEEGVIEVVVQRKDEESPDDESAPKRIRVITEDTNVLHDKLTEFFPSSYGKEMIQDFVDPIELFYAV